MNWKNVLYLLRVERKSGRLLRGIKATHYSEHGVLAYWPYWAAAILGVLGGLIANAIASAAYSSNVPLGLAPLNLLSLNFFASLPTLILLICLVLTMLQQIQISGVKATTQVMYWLPLTWKEQTLASILANLLGFPFAVVLGFASGVIVYSAFNGIILQGLLTALAMVAAAFTASATTEIVRVLQTRFVGAIYKSSGRAAVWVRLIGTLLVLAVVYVLYFAAINGPGQFINNLGQFQSSAWFVPFVWLGLTLFYLNNGAFITSLLFLGLSAFFITALYYLALVLNMRFGLYEPPAIRIQTSGIYAPKTGLLGKIGFSTAEAAIIRKDIRSFTRRRELISIFILPIIFILIPLLQRVGITNGGSTANSPEFNLIFTAMTFLLPAGVMAMTTGSILIGQEGQAVWRIYASPISPKNLVKSKLFFTIILSTIILVVTSVIGIVFYHPSFRFIIIGYLEGFLIIPALSAISLSIGFRGADFSQTRRARMVRQEWSFIDFIACAIAGLAILAPFVPFVISALASNIFGIGSAASTSDLAIAAVISAIIASAITAVFWRVNLNSAKELLRKAEV